MIDDERIERLLRARPAADARYEPGLADLVDADRSGTPVVGSLRWRYGNPAVARLLPVVLLAAAILVAATAVLVGGTRPDRLVVTESSPPTVTPEPIPIFPSEGVTAILDRFSSAHWPTSPGVIIDVSVRREGRVWAAATGPNLSSTMGLGITPGSTIVRVGATGHLLVTAAVLLLADRGRLDIDAPVSRYLADWPGGDSISVRHLLDGSSGVAAFGEPIEQLAAIVAAEPTRAWTQADALRIAREGTARFEAGARQAAVDTEDVLLAAIVEAATRMPYWDVLEPALREINPPEPEAVVPDPSYAPDRRQAPPVNVGLWDPDGSGTLVEVPDLPQAVIAVLGPGRSGAESSGSLAWFTHEIHTHPLLLGDSSRALLDRTFEDGGLGGTAMCPCEGDARNGVGLVGHTGPYTALSVFVPSERLTISIVANAPVSDADLQGLLQQVHDLVWPAIGD